MALSKLVNLARPYAQDIICPFMTKNPRYIIKYNIKYATDSKIFQRVT